MAKSDFKMNKMCESVSACFVAEYEKMIQRERRKKNDLEQSTFLINTLNISKHQLPLQFLQSI